MAGPDTLVLTLQNGLGSADDVAGAHPASIARPSGLAHDPALLGMALADVLATAG